MRDFLLLCWPHTRSFQGCEDFTVYCNAVTANCDTSLEQRLGGSVFLEAQVLWYVILQVVWTNCNYPLIEQQFHCQDAAEQVHMKLILCASSSFQSRHSLCLGKASGMLFFPIQSLLLLIMRTHGAELGAGSPFFLIHLWSKSCQSHSHSTSFCFFRAISVCKSARLLLALSPWCSASPGPASFPARPAYLQTDIFILCTEIRDLSPAQIPSTRSSEVDLLKYLILPLLQIRHYQHLLVYVNIHILHIHQLLSQKGLRAVYLVKPQQMVPALSCTHLIANTEPAL